MINNITIGADPELFLSIDNKIISAEGLIEGTKESPFSLTPEGHAVQLDNVAVEFNIPPSYNWESFKNNINFCKNFLTDKFNRQGIVLSEKSSNFFKRKELQSENAKTFGCSPDFNVYTKKMNDAPDDNVLLRSVAGHIHIGYNQNTQVSMYNSELIMKAFDLFVTIPSILLDEDTTRRKLYGRAGSFRFKEYGLEARTLSNYWIFDEDLMKKVYDNTLLAVELALNGNIQNLLAAHENEIIIAINTYDRTIASKLIREVITPFYERNEIINKKQKQYVQ